MLLLLSWKPRCMLEVACNGSSFRKTMSQKTSFLSSAPNCHIIFFSDQLFSSSSVADSFARLPEAPLNSKVVGEFFLFKKFCMPSCKMKSCYTPNDRRIGCEGGSLEKIPPNRSISLPSSRPHHPCSVGCVRPFLSVFRHLPHRTANYARPRLILNSIYSLTI